MMRMQAQQLLVDLHRGLHGGLRVEFRREGDLEQHVLHHVAAVGALELERAALEEHVVEAPGLGGEHRGIAHLAGARDEREAHGTAGGVARRPALARAGVGRMPVGAKRLAVDPGERDRVDHLLAREPQHAGDHRRGGDLHQHHVVQAHLVEAVLQRDAALDLVRLDHAGQHVTHGEGRLAGRHGVARQPVGGHEDAAHVVRGVAPFGGEPRVVEIEPADHRAEAECRLHRIELVGRTRHLGAVRHDRSRHDRSEQLRAGRIGQRLEAAAERIQQAVMGGPVGLVAADREISRVIGDVDQHLVRLGTYVGNVCGHWRSCFQARRSIGTNARLSGPV